MLTVIGWLLFGPRPRIGVRTIALTLLGYPTVALNCLLVAALFLVVSALYRLLDTRLPASESVRV